MYNRNLVIAATSNLSTAYNLVVINIAHVIISYQYCGGADACPAQVEAAATASLVGAILGQLTFGYVGDCIGRGPALQITMALSILGALISAFATPFGDYPPSVLDFLALSRFLLGLGVGGVYPLSATIATESSSDASRGRNASIVFSMQGVAYLTAPLLAWLLLSTIGVPPTDAGSSDTGLAWRVMLGCGALPGIALLPFKSAGGRNTPAKPSAPFPEAMNAPINPAAADSAAAPPNDDEAPQIERVQTAPPAPARKVTLLGALRQRKYWGKLLGTAGGWFLFDITFYGNALFQPTVLSAVFNVDEAVVKGGPSVSGDLAHNLCAQMAVVAAIGLPGYYVAVYHMDSVGRRRIQLQGFACMAVTFATLGLAFEQMEKSETGRLVMLFLYGLTFFFSNYGPNSTTFILPSETYPEEVRSTLNGFSAACGKLGATIGTSSFKPLKDSLTRAYGEAAGLRWTMLACSVVALFGLLVTFLFVEDRRGFSMNGAVTTAPVEDSPAPAAANGDHSEGAGREEEGEAVEDGDEESSFIGREARLRLAASSAGRPEARVRAQ